MQDFDAHTGEDNLTSPFCATDARAELALKLLSEIAEAVIVTDADKHVIYWNGAAEHLYGLKTHDVLGRRLDLACPELALNPKTETLCTQAPTFSKLHPQPNSASQDVILWAEDDDNDALLLARAWHKAGVPDRLVRVRDGTEAIRYLSGDKPYDDRHEYPLPRLLLLDIKMPSQSGLDVVRWLQWQSRFQELPVVVLTSSSSAQDIQEATRLHVKGYLVKPVDTAEWVMKVRTVTSQCR
jgi:CheY-like chemotaxis protein